MIIIERKKKKGYPFLAGLGVFPCRYKIGGVTFSVKSVFTEEKKDLRDCVKRVICTDHSELTNDEKSDMIEAEEIVLTADENERSENGSL